MNGAKGAIQRLDIRLEGQTRDLRSGYTNEGYARREVMLGIGRRKRHSKVQIPHWNGIMVELHSQHGNTA